MHVALLSSHRELQQASRHDMRTPMLPVTGTERSSPSQCPLRWEQPPRVGEVWDIATAATRTSKWCTLADSALRRCAKPAGAVSRDKNGWCPRILVYYLLPV